MTALTTTDALIDQFLAKAETAPPPAHKRLVFAIDATASRERQLGCRDPASGGHVPGRRPPRRSRSPARLLPRDRRS